MNLVRIEGSRAVFALKPREKEWLEFLLDQYPVVPTGHHQLSRTAGEAEFSEEKVLLDEAADEARKENRGLIRRFLAELNRLDSVDGSFELTIEAAQVDRLLEVLNDVRLGCWVLLGRPDPDQRREYNREDEGELRLALSLDLAGLFQAKFLAALDELEGRGSVG